MKALVEKGADINVKSHYGTTSLIAASRNGHRDIVKTLLDKDADVNETNNDGETALMVASANGHFEIVETLLKSGAEVNEQSKKIKYNYSYPDIIGMNTALMLASKSGHLKIVKLLMKSGADINIKGHGSNAALHYAIKHDHYELVKVLIKNGADITVWDLNFAVLSRTEAMALTILENVVEDSKNEFVNEALWWMAVMPGVGKAKNVHFLLRNGADVNSDFGGETPLIGASRVGNLEALKALLSNGAEVNKKDYNGKTALMWAKEGKKIGDRGAASYYGIIALLKLYGATE